MYDNTYMYENEACEKHDLKASCNSCERLLMATESKENYINSGGYCEDCAKELL